jgi:hypothetical protein
MKAKLTISIETELKYGDKYWLQQQMRRGNHSDICEFFGVGWEDPEEFRVEFLEIDEQEGGEKGGRL